MPKRRLVTPVPEGTVMARNPTTRRESGCGGPTSARAGLRRMYNPSRMSTGLDRMLRAYAELTVKIGLNLQPRQRLLIIGPLANGGCSLEAAPLVRQITAAAYDAGARLVETLWGDEALLAARFDARAARFVRRVLGVAAHARWSSMSRPGTPCSRSTPTIRIC